jgi:hypothetical protein
VVENPWIQWCVLIPREIDDPRYDEIRRVAFRALDALGMDTGLSHMEWFRRPDGSVMISEVGARPGGAQISTLISYAHDADSLRRLGEADGLLAVDLRGAASLPRLRLPARPGGRTDPLGARTEEVLAELGPLVMEKKLPTLAPRRRRATRRRLRHRAPPRHDGGRAGAALHHLQRRVELGTGRTRLELG